MPHPRHVHPREGSNGSNYGRSSTLLLDGDDGGGGGGGGGDNIATLISWDLSQIPQGAAIEAASVTFEVFDPSDGSYGIYELKRPREEIEWKLKNTSDKLVSISRIDVTWPAEQGNAKKVKRDKVELHAQ